MTESGFKSAFSLPALHSDALSVTNGANLGDALSFADELVPDDIYQIAPNAKPTRLSLVAEPGGSYRIAPSTAAGMPGATVHLDCCLTLMSPDGQTTELLVMVEVDNDGDVAESMACRWTNWTPRSTTRWSPSTATAPAPNWHKSPASPSPPIRKSPWHRANNAPSNNCRSAIRC